jgi:hypothetical protein
LEDLDVVDKFYVNDYLVIDRSFFRHEADKAKYNCSKPVFSV